MTLTNVSPNYIVSLEDWNTAIDAVVFSQFLPEIPNDFPGVLNAYTVTNKSQTLSNITSFATQYAGNKSVRSNYMDMTVIPSAIPNNTWTTLTASNVSPVSVGNQFYMALPGDNGSQVYGRITSGFNPSACTITTLDSSLYFIYAELRFINPSSTISSVRLRIIDTIDTPSIGNNVAGVFLDPLVTATQTRITQAHFITKSYQPNTFSVQLLASSLATGCVVRFGYAELIAPTSVSGNYCGTL